MINIYLFNTFDLFKIIAYDVNKKINLIVNKLFS